MFNLWKYVLVQNLCVRNSCFAVAKVLYLFSFHQAMVAKLDVLLQLFWSLYRSLK